jgi:opacity protein-like surface antigen
MRRFALSVVWLLVFAAIALPAGAQQGASLSVMGGLTLPLLDARDAMGAGWNVGVAGAVTLASGIGVRADYLYSRFAVVQKNEDVALGPLLPAFQSVAVRAKSQMHLLSLDATWTRTASRGARFYVMAGPTLFRRRVQLFGTGPYGPIRACEAQWLRCPSQGIPFGDFVGIAESADIGFNVGAGVALHTGLTALVTIEARYYYVNGPSFHAADGHTASASAHFVPVTLGLRF